MSDDKTPQATIAWVEQFPYVPPAEVLARQGCPEELIRQMLARHAPPKKDAAEG